MFVRLNTLLRNQISSCQHVFYYTLNNIAILLTCYFAILPLAVLFYQLTILMEGSSFGWGKGAS